MRINVDGNHVSVEREGIKSKQEEMVTKMKERARSCRFPSPDLDDFQEELVIAI